MPELTTLRLQPCVQPTDGPRALWRGATEELALPPDALPTREAFDAAVRAGTRNISWAVARPWLAHPDEEIRRTVYRLHSARVLSDQSAWHTTVRLGVQEADAAGEAWSPVLDALCHEGLWTHPHPGVSGPSDRIAALRTWAQAPLTQRTLEGLGQGIRATLPRAVLASALPVLSPSVIKHWSASNDAALALAANRALTIDGWRRLLSAVALRLQKDHGPHAPTLGWVEDAFIERTRERGADWARPLLVDLAPLYPRIAMALLRPGLWPATDPDVAQCLGALFTHRENRVREEAMALLPHVGSP